MQGCRARCLRPGGEEPMNRSSRSMSRCLVCGFAEVRSDEAVDGEVVFLGWCPRCDHRWTGRERSVRPAALRTLPEAPTRAA
jgi:hypothetical protein